MTCHDACYEYLSKAVMLYCHPQTGPKKAVILTPIMVLSLEMPQKSCHAKTCHGL